MAERHFPGIKDKATMINGKPLIYWLGGLGLFSIMGLGMFGLKQYQQLTHIPANIKTIPAQPNDETRHQILNTEAFKTLREWSEERDCWMVP